MPEPAGRLGEAMSVHGTLQTRGALRLMSALGSKGDVPLRNGAVVKTAGSVVAGPDPPYGSSPSRAGRKHLRPPVAIHDPVSAGRQSSKNRRQPADLDRQLDAVPAATPTTFGRDATLPGEEASSRYVRAR
jgi:hypothetical protein